jgi:hypothetical protein
MWGDVATWLGSLVALATLIFQLRKEYQGTQKRRKSKPTDIAKKSVIYLIVSLISFGLAYVAYRHGVLLSVSHPGDAQIYYVISKFMYPIGAASAFCFVIFLLRLLFLEHKPRRRSSTSGVKTRKAQ